jgi:hypothetical protein
VATRPMVRAKLAARFSVGFRTQECGVISAAFLKRSSALPDGAASMRHVTAFAAGFGRELMIL